MGEAWAEFEWPVAPAYDWKDWLDEQTFRPVGIPQSEFLGLDTPAAVEATVNHLAKTGTRTGPVLCFREGKHRMYRPLHKQYAALFRTFAALDYTDRDAIQAFATEYGWLGLRRQEQYVQGSARRAPHSVVGENHLGWAWEICLMQEAIRFEARIATTKDWDRQRWLFNRQLQHVQGRAEGIPLRYVQTPLTLLAALWLQLAMTLEGTKRFIECKYCGRPIEISTEQTGFRTHREFCSDSCKTKDYRRRKDTVLKLAKQGKTIPQIVEQVGTERATVRRWLKATKLRRP
jgi:endogenous inhibitor of DNA gyrase (YacG/DUF329 family)